MLLSWLKNLVIRKSKPVILSAAIIWGIIAFYFSGDKSYAKEIEHALEHNILEFAEFFYSF